MKWQVTPRYLQPCGNISLGLTLLPSGNTKLTLADHTRHARAGSFQMTYYVGKFSCDSQSSDVLEPPGSDRPLVLLI